MKFIVETNARADIRERWSIEAESEAEIRRVIDEDGFDSLVAMSQDVTPLGDEITGNEEDRELHAVYLAESVPCQAIAETDNTPGRIMAALIALRASVAWIEDDDDINAAKAEADFVIGNAGAVIAGEPITLPYMAGDMELGQASATGEPAVALTGMDEAQALLRDGLCLLDRVDEITCFADGRMVITAFEEDGEDDDRSRVTLQITGVNDAPVVGSPDPAPEPIRLMAVIDGGVLQSVIADREGVAVTLLDYDCEGGDHEDIYDIPQGPGRGFVKAYVKDQTVEIDAAEIDMVLSADLSEVGS